MEFTSRLAVPADVPALTALMDQAIVELQRGFSTAQSLPAGRSWAWTPD